MSFSHVIDMMLEKTTVLYYVWLQVAELLSIIYIYLVLVPVILQYIAISYMILLVCSILVCTDIA